MACDCRLCRYGREVQAHLNALPEKQAEFFEDMYMQLMTAELDRDVNQAVINGTWPSADEQIAWARAPLIPENIHCLSYNTFDIIP